jgi:hypothetical protein
VIVGLMMELRGLARALGGEVSGSQVLAPGPGHSAKDRSLSVRPSPAAPDGFLAFSHAGDPWPDCRDHVRSRLGIERRDASRWATGPHRRAAAPGPEDEGREKQTAHALRLWAASIDPRGTIVERYLGSRALDLGGDIAETVVRWHPGVGAMVVLFRNIRTDEPQAVSRTFLDREGRKIGRRFLGPVAGAAVKLDADEAVTLGLHIGEGVETCLAARALGVWPTWALGSAGAVAAFPVLDGIECLTLLEEHDSASARAVAACAARWYAAGREVLINRSLFGKDLNDALRAAG